MNRVAKHLVRGLFSLLVMAAVVVLGQWPLGEPSGNAIIRLSLRSTRAKVQVCRDRSQEELDALPVHMREPSVCDTFAPPFQLTVSVDGERLVDRTIDPGGVKGDRPLIVSEEMAVEPRAGLLEVSWIPLVDDAATAAPPEVIAELPRFELSQEVELVADRIVLVELDDRNNTLRVHGTD